MPMRKDCVFAMSRMIGEIEILVGEFAPDAVGTVGEIAVIPNSRNTVAGHVDFTVDLRHPIEEKMIEMEKEVVRRLTAVAEEVSIGIEMKKVSDVPKINFDLDCINAIRDAAAALNLPAREIVSGAGHDAMYLSTVAPASMIFVPCENGLSHNEDEAAKASDLAAGCNVLLHAMLSSAEAADG